MKRYIELNQQLLVHKLRCENNIVRIVELFLEQVVDSHLLVILGAIG